MIVGEKYREGRKYWIHILMIALGISHIETDRIFVTHSAYEEGAHYLADKIKMFCRRKSVTMQERLYQAIADPGLWEYCTLKNRRTLMRGFSKNESPLFAVFLI